MPPLFYTPLLESRLLEKRAHGKVMNVIMICIYEVVSLFHPFSFYFLAEYLLIFFPLCLCLFFFIAYILEYCMVFVWLAFNYCVCMI